MQNEEGKLTELYVPRKWYIYIYIYILFIYLFELLVLLFSFEIDLMSKSVAALPPTD